MTTVPWLLVGDFNSILSNGEHLVQPGLLFADYDFIHCVNSIEVSYCSFSGPLFTWSNKQFLDIFLRNWSEHW